MTATSVIIGTRAYPYRKMVMFHMACEDLDKLHEMADKIGVNRKWFQDKPGRPHYDICKSKKQLALKYGAEEVNDREIVKMQQRVFRNLETMPIESL